MSYKVVGKRRRGNIKYVETERGMGGMRLSQSQGRKAMERGGVRSLSIACKSIAAELRAGCGVELVAGEHSRLEQHIMNAT